MKLAQHIVALSMLIASHPFLNDAVAQSPLPFQSITTTGIGEMRDDNIVRAQNEAIFDAQKKALMHAVGMLLPFDVLESQFFALRETVFDRTSDYIDNYRVLYESTHGDSYHVTIQATVAFQALEDYLVSFQFLAPKVKLPRILLMIAQQELNHYFYTCWWSFIDPEKTLTLIDQIVMSELSHKGFEVIDHSTMLQKTPPAKVYGCLDLKADAIQTLAAQFSAEVAIVGIAKVEPAPISETTPTKSVQTSINARAIRVADGSVVATLDTYIPATEPDEETAQRVALERAASHFAQHIGEQISTRWVKEGKGINLITLSVSGISSYLDFSRLKNSLKKEIPEIHLLSQKTLTEKGSSIEVESTLDAPSLAERISNSPFEYFTISISDLSKSTIEMEVKLKGADQDEPQPRSENKKTG